MSLWYESMSIAMYDLGDDPDAKARCMLAYLAMDVPRFWWKDALETGRVDSGIATLVRDLQLELSQSIDLPEPFSTESLVALAFIHEDQPQTQAGRFDDPHSRCTPEEYFVMAKKVLAKHPELAQLSRMIEKAAG